MLAGSWGSLLSLLAGVTSSPRCIKSLSLWPLLNTGLCSLSHGGVLWATQHDSCPHQSEAEATLTFSPRVTPVAPVFCLSDAHRSFQPTLQGRGLLRGPSAGRQADGDHLARLPDTLGLTLKARTGSLVLPGSSQPPGCAGRTRLSSPCWCLGCVTQGGRSVSPRGWVPCDWCEGEKQQ